MNRLQAIMRKKRNRSLLISKISLWLIFFTLSIFIGNDQGRCNELSANHLPILPDCPCFTASQDDIRSLPIVLSLKQELRARRLIQNAIIVTTHDHCFHSADFKNQKVSGITARVIAVTTDGLYWRRGARHDISHLFVEWFQYGRNVIRSIDDKIVENYGSLIIARKTSDLIQANREGKQAVILAFEGTRPLQGQIENLIKFHQMGLRVLQLYWSVPNQVITQDGYISSFAREVIRNAERLGIVIDLTHLPDRAFWPTLEVITLPPIVSHTAVAALGGGGDPLSDERILALAKKGGVIGLHFSGGYIKAQHGRLSYRDLVDHIDYIKKLVGINYIALGPDWFPERNIGDYVTSPFNKEGLYNIIGEMIRRDYSDDEIKNILGLNLIRLFGNVWKN